MATSTTSANAICGLAKPFNTTMQTYIIAHVTGTSYLGKSGWVSKAFARRFPTYDAAETFLIECGLDFEGANVEAA